MHFAIEITGPARRDVDGQVDFLLENGVSGQTVLEWVESLEAAIASLATMSERCPRIPEPLPAELPIHHLLVGRHRIIFGIDTEKTKVVVYRVFHGARRLQSSGS